MTAELTLTESTPTGRRIVALGSPFDVALAVLDMLTNEQMQTLKLDLIGRVQRPRCVDILFFPIGEGNAPVPA